MKNKYCQPKVNVKVNVDKVWWDMTPNEVKCYLTIKQHPSNKYSIASNFARDILKMNFGFYSRMPLRSEVKAHYTINTIENSLSEDNSRYYNPEHYVYEGVARLKDGDRADLNMAKKIAYYKAYRKMLKFYSWCYQNLSERVEAYCDVFHEQVVQLNEYVEDVENRIKPNSF